MNLKSLLLGGVFALLSASLVYGQSNVTKGNVTIGVRGGLTIPGFTGGAGDPVSEGYSTTTRFGAGIFAEFKVSKLFSIQPMLEYSQEGAKRNGMQALVATGTDPQFAGAFTQAWQGALTSAPQLGMLSQLGLPADFPTASQYLYADAKRDAKMDYLMLPVLAKFGWNFTKSSPWRVYVDVGPYIGLLLNAKNIVNINGSVYADKSGTALIQLPDAITSLIPAAMLPTLTGAVTQISEGLGEEMANNLSDPKNQDIKDQLHTFNWGLEGNIGLQYQINPHNKVFIEVGGNYGLMNIQKSTGNGEYLNGKNHIGAATVMIGYGYAL